MFHLDQKASIENGFLWKMANEFSEKKTTAPDTPEIYLFIQKKPHTNI